MLFSLNTLLLAEFKSCQLPVIWSTSSVCFFVLITQMLCLSLQTESSRDTPRLKVNDCSTDFLFVRGQLFCGFIGKNHQPVLKKINVAGLTKIIMGFVSDSEDNFNGFLVRWILS